MVYYTQITQSEIDMGYKGFFEQLKRDYGLDVDKAILISQNPRLPCAEIYDVQLGREPEVKNSKSICLTDKLSKLDLRSIEDKGLLLLKGFPDDILELIPNSKTIGIEPMPARKKPTQH